MLKNYYLVYCLDYAIIKERYFLCNGLEQACELAISHLLKDDDHFFNRVKVYRCKQGAPTGSPVIIETDSSVKNE